MEFAYGLQFHRLITAQNMVVDYSNVLIFNLQLVSNAQKPFQNVYQMDNHV